MCVETQPGLIEMFINVQSKDKEKKQVGSRLGSDHGLVVRVSDSGL